MLRLSLQRLGQYCHNKTSENQILETLPYLGLDIEDHSGDTVNVEYSPNRPDFSSEAGIARSLVGILGIVTGPPKFDFPKSKYSVKRLGEEILNVRPLIKVIYAEIFVTDELIKQLIAMQEDLHNGIGRKRSKVAIGIHNADVITTSLKYYGTEDANFSFVPLGSTKKQSVREILWETDQGKEYGRLIPSVYPILADSKNNVLSMPPVINGELTRLKPGISKLFIDLTGTDERVVDVSTAIIAAMLADNGAKVFKVTIQKDDQEEWTPDMKESKMKFDLALTNDILGFDFDLGRAKNALEKSRLGLDPAGNALIPGYRIDIIHPIDLSEEVALGFGIAQITPQKVSSYLAGSLNERLRTLDFLIEVLVGLGLTEIWNFSLTGKDLSRCKESALLRVENSKSESFEFLRCDIVTSLLRVLGSSTHQEYPQAIFEEGPTFSRDPELVSGVSEQEHLAVVAADSESNYTTIRSKLDAFLRLTVGDSNFHLKSTVDEAGVFAEGRTARVFVKAMGEDVELGIVGEISPATLEHYGIAVPVAGFELNLEPLLKH
ncbi:MAG: phenylalanine--tRNA ligase subunit beta [Thaumarchaeota archaeon]|nr:phenylalanine--tRNA ligase subunit beta [Nitrososphaerota archaeon]